MIAQFIADPQDVKNNRNLKKLEKSLQLTLNLQTAQQSNEPNIQSKTKEVELKQNSLGNLLKGIHHEIQQ